MKKRFIVSFLFLALCAFGGRGVFAQKLYMFTGGDYLDETAGSAVGCANDLVRNTVSMNMPGRYAVLYNAGDTVNSADAWTGPDIGSSENVHDDILEAIERCPAGEDDTIFFYWTGHGGQDDRGHFLLMPEGKGSPTMRRTEILDALKRKNPRLIVFITDSCHTYLYQIAMAPPEGQSFRFQHLITQGVPLLYANLFFQFKGVLDMNSTCPNQKAYADPDNMESTGGGTVFACAASDLLENRRLEPYDWETFVSQIDSAPLSRRYNQNTYVWQYPEKLSSYSIPSTSISRTGTWEIGQVSPYGDISVSYRPYTRGAAGRESVGGTVFRSVGWSPYRYHPETGDRIVEINGKPIRSIADLQAVIAVAGTLVTLDLIDHRKGKRYRMRTHIYPKGVEIRLGVYAEEDGGEGIRVTGVEPDSPCDRCSFYQDGTITTHRDPAIRGYGKPAAAPPPFGW